MKTFELNTQFTVVKQLRLERADKHFCLATVFLFMPRWTKTPLERFMDKVSLPSLMLLKKDCWKWTGSKSKGYGYIRVSGKNLRAPRFIWEHFNGPIAPGLEVCHTCDNPACVNPSHLFLGTHADNMADFAKKGYHPNRLLKGDKHWFRTHPQAIPKGERNRHAKLTNDQVLSIRDMFSKGHAISDLAKQFGVKYAAIYKIVNYIAWTHI